MARKSRKRKQNRSTTQTAKRQPKPTQVVDHEPTTGQVDAESMAGERTELAPPTELAPSTNTNPSSLPTLPICQVVDSQTGDQQPCAGESDAPEQCVNESIAGTSVTPSDVASNAVPQTEDDQFTRDTLTQLLSEVIELKGTLHDLAQASPSITDNQGTTAPMTDGASADSLQSGNGGSSIEDIEELRAQLADAAAHAASLQSQCDELSVQNEDLASQIASVQIQDSVGGRSVHADASNDLLSWDQRKELIYQQLEEDDFDAEDFLATIRTTDPDQVDTKSDEPAAIVHELFDRLTTLQSDVDRRDSEIDELRLLLEQKQDLAANGFGGDNDEVAVGAAAIAQMLDQDELVQQERERLQSMQKDWEEKFRQLEISTSLERAKLSRERQHLATKNEELEEQLEHLRRETRNADPKTGKKRRWLAELGLASE